MKNRDLFIIDLEAAKSSITGLASSEGLLAELGQHKRQKGKGGRVKGGRTPFITNLSEITALIHS